jgi:AcrR family transcriptional regulator
MPRPALRDDEIEAFRERLCEAATRRFATMGIDAVSLRGLADDLGCSHATPYRYFRNKDEILATVRARAFARLTQRCREAGDEDDPERRLQALGRAYLGFAREEPHAYRVAFELSQPAAAAYSDLVEAQVRAWQTIRGAVQYACERGVLAGDPETISRLYWASLHGLAGLELLGHLGNGELERLETPMIDLLLRGTRSVERGAEGAEPATEPTAVVWRTRDG